VSLGHEDVAVGRDRDVVRLIQQPRSRRLVPRARLTFRPRIRRISGVRTQVKLADLSSAVSEFRMAGAAGEVEMT
jgi:hypothetical protein